MTPVCFFFIAAIIGFSQASSPCRLAFLFGPDCRYLNLLQFSQVEIEDGSGGLKNGIECVPSPTGRVRVTLPRLEHYITWVRVDVGDERYISNLNVTLFQTDGSVVEKVSERRSVSNLSVDVQFEVLGSIVKQVLVEGTFSSSCDIYISRGQNLAKNYKDRASMSDVSEDHNASLCIDENAETACSTTGRSVEAWWKFRFPFLARISSIWITNADGKSNEIATGFMMFAYNEHGDVIWDDVDTAPAPLNSYYFSVYTNSSAAEFQVTHFHRVHFAEIIIWGDYMCGRSTFGPDCQYRCNCAEPQEQCFKNTGGCPVGVAGRPPDKENPALCDGNCPVNKVSSRDCPELCPHSICDGSGGCDGLMCRPGWQGLRCNETCPERSWGSQCQKECSDYCAGRGRCDSVHGECRQGCMYSYEPPLCTHQRTDNHLISVLVIIASSVGLLLLVISFFLIHKDKKNKRKKRRQAEEDDDDDDFSSTLN